MYTVTVTTSFSAAHRLREYDGNCERLHGHNWKVEVGLAGRRLDKLGMLVDFRTAKAAVSRAINELDHAYLNDLPPFTEQNPTTENLARQICERVGAALPSNADVRVAHVRVWESEGCAATYAPEG
jgi:6-pyruvoyltetrahydropterin/6-carboxytetrahydropterin synthase